MSKIVNLKTVRFKIFNIYDSWYSSWFEDISYTNVLFEDLMLKNYLLGVFYKLKIPTNYFYLKRTSNKFVFLYSDLFLTKKYKKSLFKNMYKEQILYFTYLIKYYTVYKNYYFSRYFNFMEYQMDLFFSDKKIKQITFIGTGLLHKSKTFSSSLIGEQKNNIFLINNIYNSSFFNFKNKYFQSVINSLFLNSDSMSISNGSIAFFYLSFMYKTVMLFSYFKINVEHSLLKILLDYIVFKKVEINFSKLKIKSTFYNNFNFSNKIDSKKADFSIFIFYLYVLFIFYFSNFMCGTINKNTNTLLTLYSTMLHYFYFFNLPQNNYLFKFPLLDLYKTFSTIKYFKLKYYKMSYIYYEGNMKKKLVKKVFTNFFYKMCMSDFIYKLETTISLYLKQRVFLFFNVFYQEIEMFPSITNAKIVADYIIYSIHNQLPLRSIFKKVRIWQLENNEHRNYLENLFFKYQTEGRLIEYMNQFSLKRYPILGIRVECSGTAKKGTRKQKIFYGDWIKDFDENTKSPNNTFSADLDYYQSFAIVKSSTLGIKVWVFFKTHLYNSNNVFISLISY